MQYSAAGKKVRLLDDEQTVVVSYTASAACKLKLRLFISFRDYHTLTHQNASLNTPVSEQPGSLSIRPYDNLPTLTFHHTAKTFEHSGLWFNNNEYLRELDRGLDFSEDLYSPGILVFDLSPDIPIHIAATLEAKPPDLNRPFATLPDPLTQALDQFRVCRSDGKPTLIAGYPWFTDWSRDTLISLPALIASGFHPEETRAILQFLLSERKQGILPNRFSDRQSTPEYNTVDAALGFSSPHMNTSPRLKTLISSKPLFSRQQSTSSSGTNEVPSMESTSIPLIICFPPVTKAPNLPGWMPKLEST